MTLNKLQHEAYKIRMTPEEKAAMRALLRAATQRSSGQAQPSPFTPSKKAEGYFFFNVQFMTRALAAFLVVILVGGTGIAYAAEGSLPGQPLYAVKLNVTEPIQTALAATPAARAEVHVALAQRRVEEAEALAAQSSLDSTTTAQLEQNLEHHVQSADDLAVEVGATDPSAAVEIKAELASSLGVHGALLASIGDESASTTTKNNSEKFAARIIARADAAAGTSASATGAPTVVAVATTPHVPTATSAKAQGLRTFSVSTVKPEATATPAIAPVPTTSASATSATTSSETSQSNSQNDELKSRAQNALDKAQSAYDNNKSKLDTDAVASLDAQFAQVQADLDAGNYTDALTLALKLQVIIQAQTRYRTNIITPLLQLKLNLNQNRHGHDGGDDNDN